MQKKILVFLFGSIALFSFSSNGQGVGIGTLTPDASAKMDIIATDRGLLIPRIALTMTTSAVPIAVPATALMIYNTATVNDVTPGFYYWDGTEWLRFTASSSSSSSSWGTIGNGGTLDGTSFIGTTDEIPFNPKP